MGFSTGDIPIDIIILAIIAGFLILRLRSVLGKKTGFERKDETKPNIIGQKTASINNAVMSKVNPSKVNPPPIPVKPKVEYIIPTSDSEVGQNLSRLIQLESSFTTQKFLEGVEVVFRKVLTAFAQEDLPTLQSMLVVDAYNAFESAIMARRNAQETQVIEVKSIYSEEITKVQLFEDTTATRAIIEVRIISNQINCHFDKDKNPVTGTESVTEFIDFWTFERLIGVNSQGVSWRLKSARSG